MKTRRFQYAYRASSSKLHKAIGEALRDPDSSLSSHKIYQEFPVNKINPDFTDGRCKFDWVILDLQVVIEGQGEQHFSPICFGGITEEEANDNFTAQTIRDNLKKQAAIEAGFIYLAIPFWDLEKINSSYITEWISKSVYPENCISNSKPEPNIYKLKLQEKAKLYRKEQYKRQKEYLNKMKRE